MKATAILFKDEMAREILAGRKTQTRRIIKNVPDWVSSFGFDAFCKKLENTDGFFQIAGRGTHPEYGPAANLYKVPYQVGQKLWVREPVKIIEFNCGYYDSWVKYQFSDGQTGQIKIPKRLENEHGAAPAWAMPWRPAGVPNGCIREMARTFITVTKIRIEKMQDGGDREFWGETQWAANPWVWVIEFEVIK